MKTIRYTHSDSKYDYYFDELGYMYVATKDGQLYLVTTHSKKTNKIGEFFNNLVKRFNK
jgi:hypothetical protein